MALLALATLGDNNTSRIGPICTSSLKMADSSADEVIVVVTYVRLPM